jgi:hypothetical protein
VVKYRGIKEIDMKHQKVFSIGLILIISVGLLGCVEKPKPVGSNIITITRIANQSIMIEDQTGGWFRAALLPRSDGNCNQWVEYGGNFIIGGAMLTCYNRPKDPWGKTAYSIISNMTDQQIIDKIRNYRDATYREEVLRQEAIIQARRDLENATTVTKVML